MTYASTITGMSGLVYRNALNGGAPSLFFDGADSSTVGGAFSVAHDASFPTTGAFSVCVWVRLNTHNITEGGTFYGRINTGPVRGYGLYQGSPPATATRVFSLITQEPGTGTTWVTGPRPTRDVTYFLVGTYDGASTSCLYVNGRRYNEDTAVPAPPGANTDNLIGVAQGWAQEFALFNRALTASEVADLYEAGAGRCNRLWYASGYASTSQGIVAAWPFDETTTATVSGITLVEGANGHAGIAYGSRTAHTGLLTSTNANQAAGESPVACKDGGTSWRLNDIGALLPDSRFTVANHTALEPTDFSLVAWVSPSRWPGGILEKSDGSDTGYGFGINAAGRPYVWVGDGGGADVCLADAADAVPLNGRVLLVGTYEAATTTLKLYRQNVLLKTLVGTNGLAHSGNLLVGYDHRASAVAGERYFPGRLDKVALYNTVLSEAEVMALQAACRCVGQRSRAYLLA